MNILGETTQNGFEAEHQKHSELAHRWRYFQGFDHVDAGPRSI
jgi:hypothetical protein